MLLPLLIRLRDRIRNRVNPYGGDRSRSEMEDRSGKTVRRNYQERFGAEAGTRTPTPLRALDPETGAGDEPALSLSAKFRATLRQRSTSRCTPQRLSRTLGALED